MDSNSGKLYNVSDDTVARRLGLIPVERNLSIKERSEMQIRLYQPCGCGSDKKFKFCCHSSAQGK